MPELPEVEVLRLTLEPRIIGARIEDIQVWNGDLREPVDRRNLSRRVRGRSIVGLRRRSKYLWIDLERDQTLVIHLGMSGRLTLAPADAEREIHEHVAFSLDSNRRLRFCDTRRFGLVFALPTSELDTDRHFAHLGVEPLNGELTGEGLQELATGCRGPVKNFLMDARRVVGVGNIYACEALHRAGIHPTRSVARISLQRWQQLAHRIVETLHDAIAQGGTTLNDFSDAVGQAGYFKVSLAVYGRAGRPCQRCAGTVRRIVQAGRSTFYCPLCQH